MSGSGSGGEILAEDILAAANAATAGPSQATATDSGASAAASSAGTSLETPGVVGRLMAERTTQSWTTAPHFFVTREIDAGALIAAREKFAPENATAGKNSSKPTHTDLLIALVARVLAVHPRMNASWTPEGIRLQRDVNVAVAIAVEDGVVAPVIHNADAASVTQISDQRRQKTERARTGKLQPADLAGATFTISNLGMYGVDAFTAIIVAPQAAILAVARIADRVVPSTGIRPFGPCSRSRFPPITALRMEPVPLRFSMTWPRLLPIRKKHWANPPRPVTALGRCLSVSIRDLCAAAPGAFLSVLPAQRTLCGRSSARPALPRWHAMFPSAMKD